MRAITKTAAGAGAGAGAVGAAGATGDEGTAAERRSQSSGRTAEEDQSVVAATACKFISPFARRQDRYVVL
jgi:hypothetical protein